jgi:integrase
LLDEHTLDETAKGVFDVADTATRCLADLTDCRYLGCCRRSGGGLWEQIVAVLVACDHLRERFLIALLAGTGMPIGKGLGLRHEDIDTAGCLIRIQPRCNVNGARATPARSRWLRGLCGYRRAPPARPNPAAAPARLPRSLEAPRSGQIAVSGRRCPATPTALSLLMTG